MSGQCPFTSTSLASRTDLPDMRVRKQEAATDAECKLLEREICCNRQARHSCVAGASTANIGTRRASMRDAAASMLLKSQQPGLEAVQRAAAHTRRQGYREMKGLSSFQPCQVTFPASMR